MNKERELLKRVRDTLRGLEETHYDLYWDIQAELDLAPQKREPPQTAREMYQRGYAKAKDDLKREPFNPEFRERISKAYGTKSEQKAFEEGIIFAEISHKIGVENE
jgi:hypothetical protein